VSSYDLEIDPSFSFTRFIPPYNFYIELYQLNRIHGKEVGPQVRKLSYRPTPAQIITIDTSMSRINLLCPLYAFLITLQQL